MTEKLQSKKKSSCVCKKCSTEFVFKPDECKFYEFGTYSDKTVECPECGCINSVRQYNAFGQDVNNDKRYFK